MGIHVNRDVDRTVEDFVRDMCLRGRTVEQVLVICRCTRWQEYREEVKALLKEHGVLWRKEGFRHRRSRHRLRCENKKEG